MINLFASSVVDRGFAPRSGPTKAYRSLINFIYS
jgi:hypothetical protein